MIRILLLSLCFAMTCWSEEVIVTVTFCDEQEAQADLASDWVSERLRVQADGYTRTLKVAPGTHPIPVSTPNGQFILTDWKRFLASPLNPTLNAMRLLGLPSQRNRLGERALFLWIDCLRDDRGLSYDLILRVSMDGQQVEWSYVPRGEPIPTL